MAHHPGFDAMLKRHVMEVELLSASIKAATPKGFMGKKPAPAAVAAAEARGAERRAAQAALHEKEVADFVANPPPIEAVPSARATAAAAAAAAAASTAAAAATAAAASAAPAQAAAGGQEAEEAEEGGEEDAAGGGGKLSRKERRRAKQAQLNAEQARADAALYEGGGGGGGSGATARDVEMRALVAQLEPLGLCIAAIPADGNCLYRAVADQLQLQLRAAAGAPVSAALAEHRALRVRAAEFIRTFWEEYAPFLHYEAGDGYAEAERTGDLRSAVIRYSERMASTSSWGGHPELRALANVLGCSIVVFCAGAKPLQFDPKGGESSVSGAGGTRQLRISFHAHQLSAGEHYNSVRSV